MVRELRRPKTGYEVLRRKFDGKRDAAAQEIGPSAQAPSSPPPVVDSAGGDAPPESTAAITAAPVPSIETGPTEDAIGPIAPPVAPPMAPASKPAAPGPKTMRSDPARTPELAERVTVKFNLSAPAPGTFALYDQAAVAMGHRRALPALIARAFADLEADLARGLEVAHQDYPTSSGTHRTSSSRTLPVSLLARARQMLDPFELLSPTAFGSLLAATALARYLGKRTDVRP